MSDKYYTAEKHNDGGFIRIHIEETGYIVTEAEARKLRDSLDAILPAAFALAHAHLAKIMPLLPAAKLATYFPHLVKAMADHQINTPLRAAAFLAQTAHESGEFRWLEEIWGPTAQQKKYEPPGDLAEKLGNTEKGDGYRYRGRGIIMITGRFNFRKYGNLLGVDFVNNPDLAAKPEYAFQIAALYWKLNKCNELADVGDFKGITKAINGGLTNLADRERYYEIAKKALGIAEGEEA